MAQRRKDWKASLPSNLPETDGDIRKSEMNEAWVRLFKDWHVRTVFYFALAGFTEEEMATAFGVEMKVLLKWKSRFPAFRRSMREGKREADSKVAHSMFKSATGFEVDAEQIIQNRVKEYDPSTGRLIREYTDFIRVPIRKYYPPVTKAGIWWLERRQPHVWSNRDNASSHLTLNQHIDLRGLSLEELKVLSKIGNGQGYNKVEDVNTEIDADADTGIGD